MDSLKKDNKSSDGILHSTVAWCNATTQTLAAIPHGIWRSVKRCLKLQANCNSSQLKLPYLQLIVYLPKCELMIPAMPSSICQSPTMIAATERAASTYIDISHA